MKYKHINVGVFNTLVLYIKCSYNEWKKEAENKYKILIDTNSCGMTLELENGDIILWVNSEDIPLLAHETVHAADFILSKIGEPQTREVRAYIVQYLLNEILKK